jgi:hypothetical protein
MTGATVSGKRCGCWLILANRFPEEIRVLVFQRVRRRTKCLVSPLGMETLTWSKPSMVG